VPDRLVGDGLLHSSLPWTAGELKSHATGKGHKHRDDSEATGHIYGGIARLLRLLRNSRGADRPCSLGAAQAAMCPGGSGRPRAVAGLRPQLAANTAGSGRGP
jgi:hypothetical protein